MLLFICACSINSLKFQEVPERVLASLKFIDYKSIMVCIFKELVVVKSHDIRISRANPHDFYFVMDLCLIRAQGKFEDRFSLFFEILSAKEDSAFSNSQNVISFFELFPIEHDPQRTLEQISSEKPFFLLSRIKLKLTH